MKYKNISKVEIKKYIKWCNAELIRLEKEGQSLLEENLKLRGKFIDLTDHYLREEHLRGQIAASNYILNNCYKGDNCE